MKYLVKETYIATANNKMHEEGTVHISYTGLGGYCSDNPDYLEGWKRKHFAERCIKEDSDWEQAHPELCKNWNVTREVVEA